MQRHCPGNRLAIALLAWTVFGMAVFGVAGFGSAANAQAPAGPTTPAPATQPSPQPPPQDGMPDQAIMPIYGNEPTALSTADATAASPFLVVFVDVQLLLQQSAAGRSIQRQADAQKLEYDKAQATLEERLRQSEQELGRLRTTLSADEFEVRRAAFERQVGEMRKTLQDRSKALQDAFNVARNTMLDDMMKIIAEVAQERKATLVVPKQVVVFYTDRTLEITDVVLQRLNERMPYVDVQVTGK